MYVTFCLNRATTVAVDASFWVLMIAASLSRRSCISGCEAKSPCFWVEFLLRSSSVERNDGQAVRLVADLVREDDALRVRLELFAAAEARHHDVGGLVDQFAEERLVAGERFVRAHSNTIVN